MLKMLNKKTVTIFTLFFTSYFVGNHYYENYQKKEQKKEEKEMLSFVKASVSQQIVSESTFPKKLKYADKDIYVQLTIDRELQKGVEKLLKRYPADHTAVVILDNETGSVLAAAGVQRDGRKINYSLPFTSTHPSASLIKVITTANLLENGEINPHTKMNYRGRGTTLYKYQLKSKVSRWTRWISFRKAFAYSNNVIFGKAAINKTSAQSIFKTAFKFGFNRELMDDFNLGPSRFTMPESQYHLAELASGFNKDTMISPVHAAAISLVVANEGELAHPNLISEVRVDNKKLEFEKETERVISASSARDLSEMMELTVQRGTARAVIRGRGGRKVRNNYEVGAKTGTITGGTPYGKRDWLSFYAKPKKELMSYRQGISVAIMNVNEKYWHFKATFLAKKIIGLFHEHATYRGVTQL